MQVYDKPVYSERCLAVSVYGKNWERGTVGDSMSGGARYLQWAAVHRGVNRRPTGPGAPGRGIDKARGRARTKTIMQCLHGRVSRA